MDKLYPRFVFDGKVKEVLDVDPIKGNYKLEFRVSDAVNLPPIGTVIPGKAADRTVAMRVGLGPGANQRAITSCDGGYTKIRELGQALGMRHGDHMEFTPQSDGTYMIQRANPAGIFFKLGQRELDDDQVLTGLQTLALFEAYLEANGTVWFGIRSGNFIKAERVEEYRRYIERRIPVRLYLATGISGGGTGQVDYVAELADLVSGKEESDAPGPERPPEFSGDRCRTWLKLRKMTTEPIPFSDFVLARDLTGLEAAVAGQSAILYVRRVGAPPGPYAGPEPIVLIGSSRNVDEYYQECREFVDQNGKLMYWWSFRIRDTYRDRLKQQGSYTLLIYEGKPVQQLTYRCEVEAFYSAPTTKPIPSPEGAYTLDDEKGRTQFGDLVPRCWMRIRSFEKLSAPLPLSEFVEYDTGDDIHPSALLNSFSYVRAKAGSTIHNQMPSGTDERFVERDLTAILEAFEAGLIYDDQDIKNVYHALHALERKHFVILHGVAGTGKSQFAQAYTNALYGRPLDEAGNPHFCMVSVQPTWQDRTHLLGYYSPLEEGYIVPPFLKHVLAAKQNLDRPYVICLDEMNLAVVEHYLADFLSAWESGERIPLHGRAEVPDPGQELEIPPNLYVIGTVNMDETTHGFSPKVLDRAFSIEFSDVDVKRYGDLLADKHPDHEQIIRATATFLEDLYKILQPEGLHFAFRTVKEICLFMVANERDPEASMGKAVAWDRMVVQKVLPRLRGDDRQAEMLKALEEKLTERIGATPGGMASRSLAVINRMKRDLKYGTFQFWR